MKKTLVILTHPDFRNSIYNSKIVSSIEKLANVDILDLYSEYKDFKIDVKKEQDRLLNYDRIVFQFPLYWYSSPPLLKEWQDVVLTQEFAFDADNDVFSLKDKELLIVTTAGDCASSYEDGILKEFEGIQSLLVPFKATALYIKMIYKEPLVLYNADANIGDIDNLEIDNFIDKYLLLLQ